MFDGAHVTRVKCSAGGGCKRVFRPLQVSVRWQIRASRTLVDL